MRRGGALAALAALATALTMATATAASAQQAHGANDRAGNAADAPVEADAPRPNRSVTRHSGTFNGVRVNYTATAGETFLPGPNRKPRAAIFSTSYVRDGADPNRPVTFLFNGGPGSGSVWLHMGAFGPVRVATPSDARDDSAP